MTTTNLSQQIRAETSAAVERAFASVRSTTRSPTAYSGASGHPDRRLGRGSGAARHGSVSDQRQW